jgi:hypothetical protein
MRCSANIADCLADTTRCSLRAALLRKRCWRAFTSIGCTIGLDFGRKVDRDPQYVAKMDRFWARMAKKHPGRRYPKKVDRHVGESHVVVWCSWRIDDAGGPVGSSDNDARACGRAVERLNRRLVQDVEIGVDWSLRLRMSGGVVLTVFPDHVGPDANFDGNWEVWRPDRAYLIGSDLSCEIVDRTPTVCGGAVVSMVLRRPHRTSRVERELQQAVL